MCNVWEWSNYTLPPALSSLLYIRCYTGTPYTSRRLFDLTMAISRSDSEAKVLERLFPLLQSSLSVDEVKPFLVQTGVLTLEQCEELRQCARTSTTRGLAERALLMVSRHPKCASQLLAALVRTDSAGYTGTGHHQIIAQLKEELSHLHVKGNTTVVIIFNMLLCTELDILM